MTKVTLNNVGNLTNEDSALGTINSNSQTIEEAFDNTLSRDGTSPNEMESDLDMNDNDVINVNSLYADHIYLDGVELDGGSMTLPGSSTDNAVVRWNGTTGDNIQNSVVTIQDNGDIYTPGNVGIGVAVSSSTQLKIDAGDTSRYVIADTKKAVVASNTGRVSGRSGTSNTGDFSFVVGPAWNTYGVGPRALVITQETYPMAGLSSTQNSTVGFSASNQRFGNASAMTFDLGGADVFIYQDSADGQNGVKGMISLECGVGGIGPDTDDPSVNNGFGNRTNARFASKQETNDQPAITNITKASNGVITFASPHSLGTQDTIVLSGIHGMTELNNREVGITAVGGGTTVNISGMVLVDLGNGAVEPKITTSASHGLTVGDLVYVSGIADTSTTGAANAYLLTKTLPTGSYIDGQKVTFKASFTNTGAATININSLGVKSIKQSDGSTALSAGDITSGNTYEIEYDGTNFVLNGTGRTITANLQYFRAGDPDDAANTFASNWFVCKPWDSRRNYIDAEDWDTYVSGGTVTTKTTVTIDVDTTNFSTYTSEGKADRVTTIGRSVWIRPGTKEAVRERAALLIEDSRDDWSNVLAPEIASIYMHTKAPDAISINGAPGHAIETESTSSLGSLDVKYDLNADSAYIRNLSLKGTLSNEILYSEEFDNSGWTKTKTSIVADNTKAPNGLTTADKLVVDGTLGDHTIKQSLSFTNGEYKTFSVYAKANGYNYLALELPAAPFTGGKQRVIFNLSDGGYRVVDGTPTAGMADLSNGWWRCWITQLVDSTTSGDVTIFTAPTDYDVQFTGDSASGCYLWGAHANSTNKPAAYVRSRGAAVSNVSARIKNASIITYCSTRTELKLLDTELEEVYLTESGREGLFKWVSSISTATHTADTQEGIYVAPSAGSTGAWVRQFSGKAQVEWFGCSTSSLDNSTVIQAAWTFSGANRLPMVFKNRGPYTITSKLTLVDFMDVEGCDTRIEGNYTGSGSRMVVSANAETGTTATETNTVSSITQANPGVLTYTGTDNWANGDKVMVCNKTISASGMVEIEDKVFVVTNLNSGANTFELYDLDGNPVDTTNYTAYTGNYTIWNAPTVRVKMKGITFSRTYNATPKTGKIFWVNVYESEFDNVNVDRYDTGQAWFFGAWWSNWYNCSVTGCTIVTGTGAYRMYGGRNSNFFGCWGESGDDVFQFVPYQNSGSSFSENCHIYDCHYTSCSGISYLGRLAIIQTQAGSGTMTSKVHRCSFKDISGRTSISSGVTSAIVCENEDSTGSVEDNLFDNISIDMKGASSSATNAGLFVDGVSGNRNKNNTFRNITIRNNSGPAFWVRYSDYTTLDGFYAPDIPTNTGLTVSSGRVYDSDYFTGERIYTAAPTAAGNNTGQNGIQLGNTTTIYNCNISNSRVTNIDDNAGTAKSAFLFSDCIDGSLTNCSMAKRNGSTALARLVTVVAPSTAGDANIRIVGGDVRNAVGTTKIVVPAGERCRVRDVNSWVTENAGTATILNVTSSIAVTHGLSVTPAASQISITPTMSTLSAAMDDTHMWITGITSTQFTVNIAGSASDNIDFGWYVDASWAL